MALITSSGAKTRKIVGSISCSVLQAFVLIVMMIANEKINKHEANASVKSRISANIKIFKWQTERGRKKRTIFQRQLATFRLLIVVSLQITHLGNILNHRLIHHLLCNESRIKHKWSPNVPCSFTPPALTIGSSTRSWEVEVNLLLSVEVLIEVRVWGSHNDPTSRS